MSSRLSRPSLLITDCYNATYNQPKRRLRDQQLMNNILATLRNNGNVLVCVVSVLNDIPAYKLSFSCYETHN